MIMGNRFLLVIERLGLYLTEYSSRQNMLRGSGAGQDDDPLYAADTEQRVLGIPEEYHLSPREQEILFKYAAGRSMPYLARTLYLSENTIKTHVRNIYAKLNISNRQELLDLMEDLQQTAAL